MCPDLWGSESLRAHAISSMAPSWPRSRVSVTLPRNDMEGDRCLLQQPRYHGSHGPSPLRSDHRRVHRGSAPQGTCRIPFFPGPARHFLTWLTCTATATETVDERGDRALSSADCTCRSGALGLGTTPSLAQTQVPPAGHEVLRFLDQTARVATPGDLDDNLRILDAFLARLRRRYARKTIRSYRHQLHQSRCLAPPVTDAAARPELRCAHTVPQRTFACRFPTCSAAMPRPRGDTRRMGRSSADLGSSSAPVSERPRTGTGAGLPDPFEKPSARGWNAIVGSLRAASIGHPPHCRGLPDLAMNPGLMTRRWFGARCSATSSTDHAPCQAPDRRDADVSALPDGRGELAVARSSRQPFSRPQRCRNGSLSTPEIRASTSADDERSIASCGDSPAGVRDRAILLLLARLALRRHCRSTPWRYRLGQECPAVSGKARRERHCRCPRMSATRFMPTSRARPRTCEHRVFGRTGTVSPFVGPGDVSGIARARWTAPRSPPSASRGAMSIGAATALLKSGATLEVIAGRCSGTPPCRRPRSMPRPMRSCSRRSRNTWIGGRDE